MGNNKSFLRLVLRISAFLSGLLLLYSCANVVTPTGGDKDITPPAILKTEPDNYSTNFHGDYIRLYFDEFVQVKDETKNLLISPSFKSRPDIRIKGKSVIISFNDSLHRNTTYNFNFGLALQDITEGNPLSNYQFLFSTGEKIDSMAIHGTVRDALTLEPVKDAFVMLYDRNEDSLPYKEVPLYLSKTGDDGIYTMRFIGHGPFKAIALIDKNPNYMYDGVEEDIAFSEQLITPDGVVKTMKSGSGRDSVIVVNEGTAFNFLCFKDASDSTQRMSKPSLPKPSQLVIPFRFPLASPGFKLFGQSSEYSADWSLLEWNPGRDTATLWLNPDIVKDSLSLIVSDGAKVIDTLRIDIGNLSKNNRVKKGSAETKAAFTSNASTQFGLKQDFLITFAYPLKSFDPSKLVFVQNKDTLPIKPVFKDSLKRVLSIQRKWNESATYSLYIPAGSLTNILGQPNDTLRFSWKTKSLKDYGDLKITFNPKEKGHYLLQLWNSKKLMVRQFSTEDKGDFVFDYLEPGVYKMKVVFDKNNNGHWDSGHYLLKVQPEQVSWFTKDIEVKGNWQLEETWELP